jgi:hypothetical protein
VTTTTIWPSQPTAFMTTVGWSPIRKLLLGNVRVDGNTARMRRFGWMSELAIWHSFRAGASTGCEVPSVIRYSQAFLATAQPRCFLHIASTHLFATPSRLHGRRCGSFRVGGVTGTTCPTWVELNSGYLKDRTGLRNLQNILEGSMPPVCAQIGADFDRHNLGCIKTMNRQFGARGNPRAVSDVKKTKRKGGSQTL